MNTEVDLKGAKGLKDAGFDGFCFIYERLKLTLIAPDVPGIYVVIREKKTRPMFLVKGVGRGLEGNGVVDLTPDEVRERWIPETEILYMNSAQSLNKKISEFLEFGRSLSESHPEGKLVWQVFGSEDFKMAWLPVEKDVEKVFREMKEAFIRRYGKEPFACLDQNE